MTFSINVYRMKLFSPISTAAVVGALMTIAPPTVNAKEHYHHRYHELRRVHQDIRHDVREFDRYQRAHNRDWRHARKDYNREMYGYPRVIPAYEYNYRHPELGVQIKF